MGLRRCRCCWFSGERVIYRAPSTTAEQSFLMSAALTSIFNMLIEKKRIVKVPTLALALSFSLLRREHNRVLELRSGIRTECRWATLHSVLPSLRLFFYSNDMIMCWLLNLSSAARLACNRVRIITVEVNFLPQIYFNFY
jgi:hypothetical protein